jgi:hypothetical protein
MCKYDDGKDGKNDMYVPLTTKLQHNRVIAFVKGHRISCLVDTGVSVSCVTG